MRQGHERFLTCTFLRINVPESWILYRPPVTSIVRPSWIHIICGFGEPDATQGSSAVSPSLTVSRDSESSMVGGTAHQNHRHHNHHSHHNHKNHRRHHHHHHQFIIIIVIIIIII